ncbi:MAG: sulfate ABC transporter substrate-binding protein [Synergistaceae bacterium]|nr:sulfate ABC transporter substrate-binding protein [Synergistaceae bacterium]
MFKFSKKFSALVAAGFIFSAGIFSGCGNDSASTETKKEFLNVSYDPTRELYANYNEKFKNHWENELGKGEIILTQSHGGSGKQARAVIEGLEADVVTLALAYDVIEVQKAGLIDEGWQNEFPQNSSPYTSTIVFLVRKGNPKNIQDWDDLIRDDVAIITPNPKTSGGAQWNYLAAWEFAKRKFNGDENQIQDFVKKIYKNVVVLDSGARGATTSFVQRGQGDVLIAWENEALLSKKDAPDDYEIITPSLSILAEPSVAVVDKIVDKKNNRELAEEYLNYLYSDEGQEIAAQNFYRPRNQEILAKHADIFKNLTLFTIDDAFGGWIKAHDDHFADGGTFDQIYQK